MLMEVRKNGIAESGYEQEEEVDRSLPGLAVRCEPGKRVPGLLVVMQFRLSAKLCALGVSAVAKFSLHIHRRDAENAEITHRTDQTASLLVCL